MKQQMEIPRVQVQYKSKEKDSKHNRARVIPMQRHALLILLDMRSNSLFIDAECMNCMCVTIFNYQLTFIKLHLRVTKDLILISEDIVVNIKLIGHRTLDNNKTKRAVYIFIGQIMISMQIIRLANPGEIKAILYIQAHRTSLFLALWGKINSRQPDHQ